MTGKYPDDNLTINILKQLEIGISLSEDYAKHDVVDTKARRQIVQLFCNHLVSVSEKRYYPTTEIKKKVAQSIVIYFTCQRSTEPRVSEYFSLYSPEKDWKNPLRNSCRNI